MSDIVPFKKNALAVPSGMEGLFNTDDLDDLSEGVSGGFGVLSFRGKNWRVRHGGEEQALTNDEGDVVTTVPLVLVKASKHVSKSFYESAYEEGSDEPPRCTSMDGVTPDAHIADPISPTCKGCKKNEWGSRITPAGKKAKACSDRRRIAVVHANDLASETFGGPLLLTVPGTTLQDLKKYAKRLKEAQFPYNAVITKVSFDPDASYPKLHFRAVRPLNEEELTVVASHFESGVLDDILYSVVEPAAPAKSAAPKPETKGAPDEEPLFEEPPAAKPQKKKAAVKKAAANKAAPKKPAKQVSLDLEPEVEGDTFDGELDGILDSLDEIS